MPCDCITKSIFSTKCNEPVWLKGQSLIHYDTHLFKSISNYIFTNLDISCGNAETVRYCIVRFKLAYPCQRIHKSTAQEKCSRNNIFPKKVIFVEENVDCPRHYVITTRKTKNFNQVFFSSKTLSTKELDK